MTLSAKLLLALSVLLSAAQASATECKPQSGFHISVDLNKDVIPAYQDRISQLNGDKNFAVYLQTMMDVINEKDREYTQKVNTATCSFDLNSQKLASEILLQSIDILSNPDRHLAIDENGHFSRAVDVPKSMLDLSKQMRLNSISNL